MFLITSIINYFIFIGGVKKVIVPIKNNYISETLVTHKSSNLKKIIISENFLTI